MPGGQLQVLEGAFLDDAIVQECVFGMRGSMSRRILG